MILQKRKFEKLKKELEQEKDKLREELEQEKKELLKIKEILEEKTPKVDISNVYVFSIDGINHIVRMNVTNIIGDACYGLEKNVRGFDSTLIDVFNNSVIYEKTSKKLIQRTEYIGSYENYYFRDLYGYLTPICEEEPNLLAYADKQVPLYVLQQLLYKLNNVDLDAPVLKKNRSSL